MALNPLRLTTSLYMMHVFDRVLSAGSKDTLLYLTIVAGGAVLLLAVLDSVRGRALGHVSSWIEQKLAQSNFVRMVDGTLERKVGQSEALQDLAVLRNVVGGAAVVTPFDSLLGSEESCVGEECCDS